MHLLATHLLSYKRANSSFEDAIIAMPQMRLLGEIMWRRRRRLRGMMAVIKEREVSKFQ